MALALGKLADTEALDLLTAALRDPKSPEPVRDAALEAVEMIGSKKAAIALADLLGQKSLSVDRQPRVIKALGRFKDAVGGQAALGIAQEQDAGHTGAAIDALAAIVKDANGSRRDDVAGGVRALLADPAAEVRNRAVAAAGAIGDRQAIPALITLFDKPESRFEAGLALAELPDIRACKSICMASRRKTVSCAKHRPRRSRRCATRRRLSSISSQNATSCLPRSCPSSDRSSPVWCPSRRGRCSARSRLRVGPVSMPTSRLACRRRLKESKASQ